MFSVATIIDRNEVTYRLGSQGGGGETVLGIIIIVVETASVDVVRTSVIVIGTSVELVGTIVEVEAQAESSQV